MCASYSSKSRDADFEQHASKIFTGIKEIIPEYAEKRAIWELFQNALDITEQKGIIKISKTDKGLKFEHNGKPFNVGNLTGLIKQSTNGKTYGSNKNEVGQYGTGFLSTHVYGKQILLNASVQTDEGKIKLLKDFLIDRKADFPFELIPKIQEQDEKAAHVCDNEGNEICSHLDFTSFEYLANDLSEEYINNMFKYIHNILPYIFAFNDNLNQVEILFNNNVTSYQKTQTKSNQLELLIDGKTKFLSFLADADKNIKVLLPQSASVFEDVPRLFLYYPLTETKDIGINFLIHAQEFKPNRERDFLHLNFKSDDLKKDVETNEELLSAAFMLVKDEVQKNTLLDFLAVIDISFSEKDASFLRSEKIKLVNSVKDLERIDIGSNKVALTSISYLKREILQLEELALKEIYIVVSEFYELPAYDQYIYLCNKVNNWDVEGFKLIDYNDIFNKIITKTNGCYGRISGKSSYKVLIQTVSTDSDLLNLSIVPNIHGLLKSHKDLKRWDNIEQPLIDVMDAINADVSATYLHPDFYFLTNTTSYTREEFKDDLNKFNNDRIALLERGDSCVSRIDSVLFYSTVNALTSFIDLNKVTETNKRYAQFLKDNFKLGGNSQTILSPTNILNYDSSFKLLARLYINTFSSQGSRSVKTSVEDLKEFIDILDKAPELKKNLLDKLVCYPNQAYQLKSQSSLKIDECKDEDFKTTYSHLTQKEIREELVLPGFEVYLQHTDTKTGLQLGEEIEVSLSPSKTFLPITEDSTDTLLPILLGLIESLSKSESKWGLWLPNINRDKENILLYKFRDENTRSSLFSILSGSKEKIRLLGDLAKIDNLEALIEDGRARQKEAARLKQHRDYITYVGLKIQNLIQDQLELSLEETIKLVDSTKDEKLVTQEEQNGQDFIIYRSGIPVFYIEVKSRWDSDGIIALSKRQVERCATKQDAYAVITVNVADYKARNKVSVEDISFTELINDIYVNQDLGPEFELLIEENRKFEKIIDNTTLIEFRGHIPQNRIKKKGVRFEQFIDSLKTVLLN